MDPKHNHVLKIHLNCWKICTNHVGDPKLTKGGSEISVGHLNDKMGHIIVDGSPI